MKVDMRVNIAGVTFKNPVITASGCYGFGGDYTDFYPLSRLGGVCLKGTTLEPRQGNPPPRIAETPMGMLNSVGLQNPGGHAFVTEELPRLTGCGTVLIANAAGSSIESYVGLVELLEGTAIDMIELNISCPNVKEGGMAFGATCEGAARVVRAVRGRTTKPLMVKLSPNVTDIVSIAKACEAEGADAISLINTLLGMRIDIKTRRPVLNQVMGGLSGPAVFPVALRMVWQVAGAVSVPVVGLGGIEKWQDAVEMMMAGAAAVQVGTASFYDVYAPVRIIEGMEAYLEREGFGAASQLTGLARK
jgi:dihydroorotate dehydrogenase (NAD+) catalytic subunit